MGLRLNVCQIARGHCETFGQEADNGILLYQKIYGNNCEDACSIMGHKGHTRPELASTSKDSCCFRSGFEE